MPRFLKDQIIWYYVGGMKEPLEYILCFQTGERVKVKPTDGGGMIELYTYGCHSWLEDALESQKEWEDERLATIDRDIARLTEERDRILRSRDAINY